QIDTVKLGEYTFGNYGDSTLVGIRKNTKNKSEIKVYPNPASQTCTIEFKGGLKTEYFLIIYDIEGKIVLNKTLHSKQNNLDISGLSKGAYLLKFSSEGKTL